MQKISFAQMMAEVAKDWEQKLIAQPLDAKNLWELYERWKNRPTTRMLPVPWGRMTDLFGGMRMGEVTLVTGDSGHGKTTWAMNIFYHLARFLSEPVMIFSLELGPEVAAEKIFQMRTGTLPSDGNQEAEAQFRAWCENVSLFILDHKGHIQFERLKLAIVWAATFQQCRAILVDHFHSAITAECKAYDMELMMQELTTIAYKLDISLMVICHPAKLKGDGKERPVEMDDLKGSSGLKQYADNVFSVFWNKDPVNPVTTVTLHKIRHAKYGHNSGKKLSLILDIRDQIYMEEGAKNESY